MDEGAMQSAADVYQAWVKCLLEINTETAKFVTRRLQRDAQLPLSMVKCHHPQDVVQAQIEFFQTMAEDYSNQTNRMGRIVTESFHSIDRPPALAWPEPEVESTLQQRKAA